jgi:hypothetical protein
MRTRRTGRAVCRKVICVLKHLINLGISRYLPYHSFMGIRFEELGGLDSKEGAMSGWRIKIRAGVVKVCVAK